MRTTSEDADKIYEALALSQGEFAPIAKNKPGHHANSRYAELSTVLAAIRPALSKYGIAFMQFPGVKDGRVTLVTRLGHKSGQWIEDEMNLKPQSDTPQHIGASITYARRYSACAILGVDGEEDDDNHDATNGPATKAAKAAAEQEAQASAVLAQREAEYKAKFDAAFIAKLTELKVEQKVWRDVYERLCKLGLPMDQTISRIQDVLDTMERERMAKAAAEKAAAEEAPQ